MPPFQRSCDMHSHRLLPVLLLVSLSLCATTTNGLDPIKVDCLSERNYTRGGAFDANLHALLSSLPAAAAASSGFAKNSTGALRNQAFGLAQCRADIAVANVSACRVCLDAALRNVTGSCSSRKAALIIYDDCLLRYSNTNFFGAADTSWWKYICNGHNAQPVVFMQGFTEVMNNLTWMAAYGTPRMFAAGARELTPSVRLYGMAQCTRDLAGDDCMACLSDVANTATVTENCRRKEGGRFYHRSCSVRYEIYPFYHDAQAVEKAMSPAMVRPGDRPTVNGSDPGSTGSNKQTRRTTLLVSIPVAVTLFVLLLLVVALYLCKRNRNLHKHTEIESDRHGDDEEMGSVSLPYDLSTLRAATDNFSEEKKLGEGGFGPVYKGALKNGQEIAVKRLSTSSHQGQVEMKNEALVAKLQHKNLVRLLGYCIDKHEKLVVYEFHSNKSLDKILHDPARQQELSWEQRYKIIYGIGRGLMYLHEDSRLKIIHRDLKPSNILLDSDMNPKISDFGLAKLFNIDVAVANTNHIVGTLGYMAPEYILSSVVSAKIDVFSYGVLVLEVITGLRPSEEVIKFVWGHWSQGNLPPLLKSCPADEHAQQEMLMCIHIGLLCVQDDPQFRPRMADVVHMLDSRSITLAEPTKPIFAATGERLEVAAAALVPSNNEASVSDMEPR